MPAPLSRKPLDLFRHALRRMAAGGLDEAPRSFAHSSGPPFRRSEKGVVHAGEGSLSVHRDTPAYTDIVGEAEEVIWSKV